jgi:hypothetical protein
MFVLPLASLALVLSPQAPDDGRTVDTIVKALYEVISGPAGQKRDWARFKNLFAPEAKMIAVGVNAKGEVVHRNLKPEDYETRIGPVIERDGFFEKELSRKTEQFAEIAHVFSTYETKRALADEKPLARGINSIQLWNDGKRWWVLSVYWQAESEGRKIPIKYLPDDAKGQ